MVKERISLRVGCRVMYLVNHPPLVNGSCGTVDRFVGPCNKRLPVVKWDTGLVTTLQPVRITRTFCNLVFSIDQVPLRLAGAMTVHKAQGMTLEKAAVSTDSFSPGQTYVAISRLTSLSGLFLLDWQPDKVLVDPRVIEFYQRAKQLDNVHKRPRLQ